MKTSLLTLLLASFTFISCSSNDDPDPPLPPETSNMKYLDAAGFVVGIPETTDAADPSVEVILGQLENLSRLIPQKGVKRMTADTIRLFEKKGDTRYIPLSKEDPYAGTVVIGDYKKQAAMQDTLLLWKYLSALVYERSLSADEQAQLTAHYDKAKAGSYSEVYYFNGTKLQKDKVKNPPATQSAAAYLGEALKACYAHNNYYPFVYEELERSDPEGLALVQSLFGEREVKANPHGITLPPTGFTQWMEVSNGSAQTKEIPVDLWYGKYLLANGGGEAPGIPIVASRFVTDSAMVQCRYIIETMIKRLPRSALQWMFDNHYRVGIIGAYEEVTDLPENRAMSIWWPDTNWDTRGRGYGASPYLPLMSCGEENIVYTPGSPHFEKYRIESIMVHEFAHNVDHSLRENDGYTPSGNPFETALFAAYENAQATGLWKGTYSMENAAEYWAEGVQAWFNTCRMIVPDKEGNGSFTLKYRHQLKEYDPDLYHLIAQYMPEEELTGYHFDFEP